MTDAVPSQRYTALPRPFIAGSLREATIEETLATLQNSERAGAAAFSLHLSNLATSERTPDGLRSIFTGTRAPVMVLNYRNDVPRPDDERVALQLEAVRVGAAAVDIPGDTFDPDHADWFGPAAGRVVDGRPREIGTDDTAIRRQQELIDEVHSAGAEVLLSAHVRMPLGAEAVLAIVEEFADRGADMAKVVTLCLDDDHLTESVRTMLMLREKSRIPFQFQCHGEQGKITRMLSPLLGSMLVFATDRYTSRSLSAQPLIHSMRAVLDNSRWVEPLDSDPLRDFAKA